VLVLGGTVTHKFYLFLANARGLAYMRQELESTGWVESWAKSSVKDRQLRRVPRARI
jgi:hypothetical protein